MGTSERLKGKTIVFAVNVAWSMYNFRLNLLRRLIADGCNVIIVASRDATSALLEAEGCRFIDIKISAKGLNPLRDLKTIFDFWRIFRHLKPDLIFSYTIKPHVYGTIAAKLAAIKNIAIITGLGYAFIQNGLVARIARGLYRFGLKWTDEVWFINADDESEFVSHQIIGQKKTRVLPSEGIDLEHFKPKGEHAQACDRYTEKAKANDFRFLMVSRLLWDKGVGEFIASAREIRRQNGAVTFQLMGPVGVQNRSAISETQVNEWVSDKTAQYLGEQKDVRPFIEAADCIVLPSYREGTGKVLLEAAALKKPIIATSVPGCKDVVVDGVTGFLCEAKSPTSLTAAMNKVLRLPVADRERMGEAGREFVREHFDEKKVIDIYLQTLESYLS